MWMSSSKESTCRPNALRRTVMSRPPSVSWPATPSSTRSASRIIPAQVPNAGIPPLDPARAAARPARRSAPAGSSSSTRHPGSTSPATASSSRRPAYGDRRGRRARPAAAGARGRRPGAPGRRSAGAEPCPDRRNVTRRGASPARRRRTAAPCRSSATTTARPRKSGASSRCAPGTSHVFSMVSITPPPS